MPRKQKPDLSLMVKIGITVLSFVGGMAVQAWQIAGSIATKPMLEQVDINGKKYTDDRTDQLKKYTDALAGNLKQDSYAYTDKMRSDLQQAILLQGADLKAQSVKMDMVLDAVRELRNAGRRSR